MDPLWMVVSLAGLAGLSVLAWAIWPRPAADRTTWVLTREGPVRFHPDKTTWIRWDQILSVHPQEDRVRLVLQDGERPWETVTRPVELPLEVTDDMVEGALAEFASRTLQLLDTPSERRALPTFIAPDGPPEAVLADSSPQRAGVDMGFSRVKPFERDLEILASGLDPIRHEAELKLLRSARRIVDLEHLAATDGGWLTRGARDPRVKLVRHGTGTFLAVEYDKGWSKTLSQAPFRKR